MESTASNFVSIKNLLANFPRNAGKIEKEKCNQCQKELGVDKLTIRNPINKTFLPGHYCTQCAQKIQTIEDENTIKLLKTNPEQLLKGNNIFPDKFINYTLENIEIGKSEKLKLTTLSKSWNWNTLFFFGRNGSAKTSTAIAFCKEAVINKNVKLSCIKYYSLTDLVNQIRESFSGEKTFDEQYIKNCKLLVIDDIAAVVSTEWVNEVLYRIVDHRWRENKKTIFISDQEAKNIKLDYRILSRILSDIQIFLAGDDRRVGGRVDVGSEATQHA